MYLSHKLNPEGHIMFSEKASDALVAMYDPIKLGPSDRVILKACPIGVMTSKG